MAKKRRAEKRPREYTHRQLSHFHKQQRRQRIIFISGISVIVIVVLIIAGGWFAGEFLPLHKTVIQLYDSSFDAAYFVDALAIYGKSQDAINLSATASGLADQIMRNEALILQAGSVNVTVSDQEARQFLENSGMPVNSAALDIARVQLLPDKVKSGYFDSLVPVSDNQVLMKAMMVESDTVAQMVREQIANGGNFTALAAEYAQNYWSKQNQGDYGWHPASILIDQTGTNIPIVYAFDTNVKPGDLSQPLSDNASYKQMGYWLLRVNDRPAEDSANVSALYLSSKEEALAIKARLEAGDELVPIADNLSQYSPSVEGHGELGIKTVADNVTAVFNGYVFDPATELGKWSQPLREDTLWTTGGSWLVLVMDKETDRPISTEDRTTLIGNLYSKWLDDAENAASPYYINDVTSEFQTWAIEQVGRIQ